MDNRRPPRSLLSLDLNLLKALDALFQARHITRAGQSIGLSQPAMSHALGRLRATFEDELFLRGPNGLVPTARCQALAASVRQALDLVQQAVAEPAAFDPAETRRHFRVGMNDLVSTTLLPDLVRALREQAPLVSLEVTHLPRATSPGQGGLPELLDDGKIDLAIGQIGPLPARLRVERLVEEPQVCVLAAGHEAAAKPFDLAAFAGLNHVKVSSYPTRKGWIDEALEERGLRRHVAVVVPHFTAALQLVVATDLIATLPLSTTRALGPKQLAIRPLPLPPRMHSLDLCWLQAMDSDPGLAWLRATIARIVAAMPVIEA
ncbi:LysR family transcriptional regulator [Acetobacteraceae bacterium H6797]|nr:LysR family transcriptional regulator [Acetobacteraceae bacterium H6797]